MPDIADDADPIVAHDLARSLSMARAGLYSGESALYCEDCGNKIPAPRRRAVPGCTRCVVCQEEAENA